jgi:N-acetylmuramidase-like protein/papain like protease
MSNQPLSEDSWKSLARSLAVEAPVLRAVAAVEAAGSGFLPGDPTKPKVLFEGHAFHRLTGGRFAADRPDLSYPKWDKTKYSGSLVGEWKRLDEACALDRAAALQSASWGMFQIMGFNYSYCGCPDVEAFVALQRAGGDKQMECFARFVARPPYLAALQAKDWETFAKAYNGPAQAKNNYAQKMAAAYATLATAGRSGRKRTSKTVPNGSELPPGRAAFATAEPVRQRTVRKRNVRPDSVDLRDWEYRPSIANAPPDKLWAKPHRPVKQQGDTNACTGFSLSTVVEYLLQHRDRESGGASKKIEEISGFMLYSMARRYDEWAEKDETKDSGSSLRGALKGWAKHGASRNKLWNKFDMPKATNNPADDWWLDAVKRPLGAYYRIAPENVRDIHVALHEVGSVYASAMTHDGWDAVLRDKKKARPSDPNNLPVIDTAEGEADLGHAFAIVGYTRDGFIVQNSWGEAWGLGGFAVLRYEDWLRNAMDCWVVQLGVATAEHDDVAKATSLRVEPSGRAVVSGNETLADHEISPFVINLENEGLLSQRGRFRTQDGDLKALLENHIPVAQNRWGIAKNGTMDVAIYAHGGLTDENAAANTARAWVPHLYTNKIFPIFLMWETGAVDTLRNMFQDVTRGEAELTVAGGRWARIKEQFAEWKDQRLEALARFGGGRVWGEMKQNADALTGHAKAGVVQLFGLFNEKRASLPRIKLHLIGHSAGAIVHSYLGARAIKQDLDVASISLLAPAVTIERFDTLLGGHIARNGIRVFIANLTDAAELSDDTCKPYGHSLLYLVSRSFEQDEDTPLLGMERHLVPALASHPWSLNVQQLRCPGGMWAGSSAATRATTHGGVDDDEAVRDAVAAFIRKGENRNT